uniref:Uncharacterized protein n=1 Tax=Trichogramma kaykai TaxID=54128 RepID=A0ABD2WGX7_9HYME
MRNKKKDKAGKKAAVAAAATREEKKYMYKYREYQRLVRSLACTRFALRRRRRSRCRTAKLFSRVLLYTQQRSVCAQSSFALHRVCAMYIVYNSKCRHWQRIGIFLPEPRPAHVSHFPHYDSEVINADDAIAAAVIHELTSPSFVA